MSASSVCLQSDGVVGLRLALDDTKYAECFFKCTGQKSRHSETTLRRFDLCN